MRPLIIMLVAAVLAAPCAAAEPKLPNGVTCKAVRARYAKFSWMGDEAIKRYLMELEGYTEDQIKEAKKCL